MGIAKSMEAWVEEFEDMEDAEEEFSPDQNWKDRMFDYEAAFTDSSDAKTRKLVRHYELSGVAQYGTLSEEEAASEVTLGSLHKVDIAETITELCLRYSIDAQSLRDKNPSLLSRCAVDDSDIGDLSVAVIPRNLAAEVQRKEKDKPMWHIAVCDRAPLLYCDDWVAITQTSLIVKDFVKSRNGTHTAEIPLSDLALVRQITRNSISPMHIVPWAASCTSASGLMLIGFERVNMNLSDGSVLKSSPPLMRSGLLFPVKSQSDFMLTIRPLMAASLP
eukprot:TRINITY_DN43702_c0_g1_i1.p1 TRINITY_DN43702_c0_g1~~TRINITY_DN43702_c0_g1_i1.p1  ORF type:complete len:276 (+),score=125.52 TRINITY_DN43702_c0_g1_i1:57-884(+)